MTAPGPLDKIAFGPELLGHNVDDAVRRFFGNLRRPGTTEIVVAKGWCSPARDAIFTALRPYGVVVHDVVETVLPNEQKPLWIQASVRVNDNAAAWAEYLLLRSAKFRLISKPQNRDNARWARRHNGAMPTPWSTAKQWKEKGCTK